MIFLNLQWCKIDMHSVKTILQILNFFFFFLPHHAVCRILVPWPGIKPAPPAVEARSLNHWTAMEVLKGFWILIFSWASNTRSDTVSWCWPAAGSHSSQSATRSRWETTDTLTMILYPRSYSFFFFSLTFSTVFNKLQEILNTYYKMGFVLDDFAQLSANVNALGIFKVG